MTTRTLAATLTVSLVLSSACHNLTEYQGALATELLFFNTDDFSLAGSIDGIQDGRAICSIDSRTLYVINGEGMLYKLDSDAMDIDTSFAAYTGSVAGMFSLSAPPPRSSVYVMGTGADLVEVSVASNTVLDVFQAGQAPACMVSSRSGTSPRLYVGDSQENCIREVNTLSNSVVHTTQLQFPPYALTYSGNGPWIMAVCQSEGILALLNAQYTFLGYHTTGYGMTDVTTCGTGPDFFVCCPRWGSPDGLVLRVDSLGLPGGSCALSGHPVRLAGSPAGSPLQLYVLTNTGNGTGLVTVLDYWSLDTVAEITVDGYPWDIVTHRSGEFLVVLIAG